MPGSVQSRDTWPYPWHLKHRSTSTFSRMRHFTHPTLSIASPSKLRASASVERITAVYTPPKCLYSLHWSPRSGLPSVIHSAATLFQDQKDPLPPGSLDGEDLRSRISGVYLGLHGLQDLCVGLTVLRRRPDSVARPGGRRALRHLALRFVILCRGHRNLLANFSIFLRCSFRS